MIYNHAKRPIAIFDDNENIVVQYRYNNQGERIAKIIYPTAPEKIKKSDREKYEKITTIYSLYREQRLSYEANDEGEITAHYVYLHGIPVAKVEIEKNMNAMHRFGKFIMEFINGSLERKLNSNDGIPHIYAIHTDHLGVPQLVTNSQQQLTWRARTMPFGEAKIIYTSQDEISGKNFEMNIRLPGQVYDAETKLHYNYLRDYDPTIGRYTTPDPFSDSLNSYIYASNNPLTKIDPLGLYEEDVHYYATYFLGLTAGLSENQAWILATANRYIDDNPYTEPYGTKGTNISARNYYHFTQDGWDEKIKNNETKDHYASRRFINPDNYQIRTLREYAMREQYNLCAKLQFYGEFLHAFEDTYAHRDNNNEPYGSSTGHLTGGHSPDKTFNHIVTMADTSSEIPISSLGNWQYNEARTISMEEETFNRIKNDFGVSAKNKNGTPIEWKDIKPILMEFNLDSIGGLKEITPEDAFKKSTILQQKLNQLGLGQMKEYNCESGKDERNKNIMDKNGNPIDHGVSAGIISETPKTSEKCKK